MYMNGKKVTLSGSVAQMVRAPSHEIKGHGFDPPTGSFSNVSVCTMYMVEGEDRRCGGRSGV